MKHPDSHATTNTGDRGLLRSAVLAPVAAAVALTSSPAAFSLEEVLVTARKKEESIQETPVSVSVIGKELQEATLRRLDDIQGFTPNVYIRNT